VDLNLSDFSCDIKKYISKIGDANYLFEDIIKPFYKFIEDKNPNDFEDSYLDKYFKKDGKLLSFKSYEIFRIEEDIEKAGIPDFTLKTFSISEFDDFFMVLIESLNGISLRNYPQIIQSEFSQLINESIKDYKQELYIGDNTAQILFDCNNDDKESIISSDTDSFLWYYLRVLLSGKKKIRNVRYSLSTILYKDLDFIFCNAPFGKIENAFYEAFKGNPQINRRYKFWELFYADFTLTNLNSEGKALLLMPSSTLYKTTSDFKKFRKSIVESGNLKTIIKFPRSLFRYRIKDDYVLLEVDLSSKSDYVKFINGNEIDSQIYPSNKEKYASFFEKLKTLWIKDSGEYPYKKTVKIEAIKENKYSLDFSNYFNVGVNSSNHKRSDEENLVPLLDVLSIAKQPSQKITENVPTINISKLSDSFTDFKINREELSLNGKGKRLKRLNTSAILLGKIIGSIKPSVIEINEKPVYLETNVLAFEIPKKLNLEYLIQELSSGFVQKQFKSIQSGITIPSIRESRLKNVFLRIPSLDKQNEIVKEYYSEIAKSKIKEIEGLNADLKYIEKEVFSSFAHNFKQILHKVAMDIDTLRNSLNKLHEDSLVDIDARVEFGKKLGSGEPLKYLINPIISNQNQAEQFLQNEVSFFTQESSEYYTQLNLGKIVNQWVKEQKMDSFVIKTGDRFLSYESLEQDEIEFYYTVTSNKSDIISILNNLLKNANEHGFKDPKKEYKFVIILDHIMSHDGIEMGAEMHIGNNGTPFPSDFNCNDLFKLHHKGSESSGSGIGGYSVKRKINKMGARIRCDSSFLSREEYPVQFQINYYID